REGRERPDGHVEPLRGVRAGPPDRREPRGDGDATRLFVSVGRAARVRPQDLVGAITGETSVSGREIGAIEIHERFSLVEVPSGAVDEVIAGLSGTHLKGKRPKVRRERF
ncbi:DbpA RNA binding domain-containing protein, partial [Patulibacter sp. S7RM1-6]